MYYDHIWQHDSPYVSGTGDITTLTSQHYRWTLDSSAAKSLFGRGQSTTSSVTDVVLSPKIDIKHQQNLASLFRGGGGHGLFSLILAAPLTLEMYHNTTRWHSQNRKLAPILMITQRKKLTSLCGNALGLSIRCLEILWKGLWLDSRVIR